MFANAILPNKKAALKDSRGFAYTYEQLHFFCNGFADLFRLKGRALVFILCENTVAAAAFFIGCIQNRVVPLLLNCAIDDDMLKRYISIYNPNYIFKPKRISVRCEYTHVKDFMDNELLKIEGMPENDLYENLSFLLPTSGSTGSPKLVRHSYLNLYSSAENVAAAFALSGNENAMVSLPIYFTQGLSVLCSYLHAGASAFLTDAPLSSRSFWDSMKNEKITSFTGVPYSYEVLDRLRFYTMQLPDLKVISQGGGRMTDELFNKLAYYAKQTGREFYATYGSSETTARMSCLPPQYADKKSGSIGKALPNCEISLVDDAGNPISAPNEKGEILFKGNNVTLGYAEACEDLSKGNERNGEYRTGDLAYMDEEGFYYIVGRLARFVKLFGNRISLDETERLLKTAFGNVFACAGNDKQLYIFSNDKTLDEKEILHFLKNKLQINLSAFKFLAVDEMPKNQYGKIQYAKLNELVDQQAEGST